MSWVGVPYLLTPRPQNSHRKLLFQGLRGPSLALGCDVGGGGEGDSASPFAVFRELKWLGGGGLFVHF